MKSSERARRAAAVTLSKGKMFEFGVSDEHHINIPEDMNLSQQFPLALGTIGEFAVEKVDQASGRRIRTTPVEEVLFAAQVLIATVDAKIAASMGGIVRLIAAAAFFLADSPGRSLAHCRNVAITSLEEDDAFAIALRTTLLEPWGTYRQRTDLVEPLRVLLRQLRAHYEGQADDMTIVESAEALRKWVYTNGDAYELLLGDLLSAVAIKRASISAWTCLPQYTGIEKDAWADYLKRADALKDMWPSQQMLGKSQIYAGKSAVVQMPTSAGKTRATELILRSAFKSERTSLAIVVAPFRALCYEIAQDLRSKFRADGVQVNQISDALQQDYKLDLSDFLELGIDTAPHVVVLTPEKLLYIVRQERDFVSNVGLVIYDEGHQFDDSGRGVAYELLLTSIKRALPANAQTVLISAVISNAQQLATWLFEDETKVVTDTSIQTSRHVAFTTMERSVSGHLRFDSIIEGEQEFFVPRLIAHHELSGKKRPNVFPTDESSSIALYLGCKLVSQGGVAIFVGKPDSAAKLIRDAVENVFCRSDDIHPPAESANKQEIAALVKLYEEHFGGRSFLTRGAEYGLFAHTGDTPQGIRLAIEHAMRESLLSLIVCTSTLAQGVNLPIRYLLVTTPYQSGALLKTRDFQNLIGRAGRAGMYGDGTIVFTDAKVYDITRTKRKKWEEIKALLKPELSAPTSSALLRLVRPLYNRFETRFINMKMKDIIEALIIGEEKIYKTAGDEAIGAPKEYYFTATDVYRQLEEKTRTIESVQSFLMAHQISFEEGDAVQVVRSLAKETFAYHLASSDEKSLLEWAFERIWREIAGEQLEADVLARYGRSLLGLNFSQEVDAWVRNNMFQLQISESPADILEFVWPFLDASPLAEKLRKLVPESARKALVTNWVQGKSFRRILLAVEAKEGYIRWGQKRRKVTVDLVVGFCQNDLAFQSCLVLNAVAASYEAYSNSVGDTGVEHFEKLGKLLKYGLPTEACTSIYEAGFADRVLSQKLAALLPPDTFGQDAVKAQIRKNRQKLADVLSEYPDYFKSVFASLTR